jgi:short-subunit dehydrogenase
MLTKRGDSFIGKRVLLTGAASGIGRACAIELARRGAWLALVDVDADGLAAALREVRSFGAAASAIVADLSSADAVEAVAREALATLGHIDVLFSNAGVSVVKPLHATSTVDWEWIFGINIWAPIRLARAIVPHMAVRRTGHVVVTASIAGLVGAPGMVAYSTSKFALVGFVEALRLEIADAALHTTIVCPGYVRTNLHRMTRYANDGFAQFLDASPSWYGVSSDRAARIIVDGIARKRPVIVFGAEKLGWWLKRAWPAAQFCLTRWLVRRFGIAAPSADLASIAKAREALS